MSKATKKSKKKAQKLRKLDEYDTKGYFKDLEYLARLSYLPEGTRSWMEARMYELREKANNYEHRVGEMLISQGIEFIHQAPFVFRPKTIYFCDFYLPKQRLVIEVDGSYHQSQTQSEKDSERDWNFRSVGIKVVRISNQETGDLELLSLRLTPYLNPKALVRR